MTLTTLIAHPLSVESPSVEDQWTSWHDEAARPFVPAFIGRSGESLMLDWKFAGRVLEGQGWGILDDNGELVVNDPEDIERSAHEALAVQQHEDAFFDGIEAIIKTLFSDFQDVEMLEVHFLPTKQTVQVRLVVYIDGKDLSRTVRTAKDLQNFQRLLKKAAA